MRRFLLFESQTGAPIGGLHPEPPVPGQGEEVARVPRSALEQPPTTAWDPARRGFYDIPGEEPVRDGPAVAATLLDAAKAASRHRVRRSRLRAEDAGFDMPFGRVQSDPVSRSRIRTAVIAALGYLARPAEAPFFRAWTLADNSAAALDAEGVVELGAGLDRHLMACHERAQQLRAEIDAAETDPELAAVCVGEGWP
ncbi:hypothetical protein B5C34_05185 [Pacificimonas flava]|uniref:DUF4376 domain-containing protein n=2 Tax=Pacificimonas TaxID=1960290 RepID=A0A219B3J8_9SPHN|nr:MULTISPECIES: DUF4376 domain-containing protein [Pacificimonas]MBZ6377388.1 DUF4376 domain-containing protein [Pacificimonas aurantium]OWV32905.1 hypothetical protein B5C34_05185 [Pacificimonas flava]